MRNTKKNRLYRSLNAIVAQSQNCPFGVNTKNQLKNITKTSDNTGIWRGVFQLTRVPVLSDVVLIYLSSPAVLTPYDNFLVVPVLHSVSYTMSAYSETYATPNMWAKVGVLYVKYGGTYRNLTFKGPALTLCTTRFNIQSLYLLPTNGICVFCSDLGKNCDYFPIQHKLIGFYNPDCVSTARCELDL
jgi:hypothetical protein